MGMEFSTPFRLIGGGGGGGGNVTVNVIVTNINLF